MKKCKDGIFYIVLKALSKNIIHPKHTFLFLKFEEIIRYQRNVPWLSVKTNIGLRNLKITNKIYTKIYSEFCNRLFKKCTVGYKKEKKWL